MSTERSKPGQQGVASSEETAEPSAEEQPKGPVPSSEIRTIAAQLRGGRLTANQAVDKIIAKTTERLGGGLTETARFELETFLKDLATRDPVLASKLRGLTKPK